MVVLGGTFNPPHIGHLKLAEYALKELSADKIIFMPAGEPPHKKINDIVGKMQRYEMVKLLVSDNKFFEVSDIEVSSSNKSYTAKTLFNLKEIYEGYEIFFIVGLDSFYDIEKWYKPEMIFKQCIIAVSKRGGVDSENFRKHIEFYKEKYGAKITELNMPEMEISSSDIRDRIKNKKQVKHMLTENVYKYIKENGLYKEL